MVNVIIKDYYIGSTRIKIDDSCKAKTEEERKIHIENFNRVGNEILRNAIKKETKEKIRYLLESALFEIVWVGMFIYAFIK